MERESQHLETDTARVIRESYGPPVRLDPELHRETLCRLQGASMSSRRKMEFPDGALLGLTGVLALMVVWLIVQISSGQSIMTSIPLVIMTVILMLNLALVPIASMVIVIRRRHANAC